MRTITVELENDAVLDVLRSLEELKLLRIRHAALTDGVPEYQMSAGVPMSPKSQAEVVRQLRALRHEWD